MIFGLYPTDSDLNFKYGSTPIQCPPTKPGLKGKKFHFVSAAFKTS